jgi:hypothetical protein
VAHPSWALSVWFLLALLLALAVGAMLAGSAASAAMSAATATVMMHGSLQCFSDADGRPGNNGSARLPCSKNWKPYKNETNDISIQAIGTDGHDITNWCELLRNNQTLVIGHVGAEHLPHDGGML